MAAQSVMVFGAGVSGRGAAGLLANEGKKIVLVDDKVPGCVSSAEAEGYLDDTALFVKSPGIPYTPLVRRAMAKNIKIVNDIEIAYRYLKEKGYGGKLIAVTGTNGKTTVTTKITELLRSAGRKAASSGNIGASFAELAAEENGLSEIVLEMSSFQLENIDTFRADIAMIINLTPDHLERYRDLDDYYETKFRIADTQGPEGMFLLNLDSPEIMARYARKKPLRARVATLSRSDPGADYTAINGVLRARGRDILDCDKLSLKGEHNLENALFIVATADILGLPGERIREFLYHTETVEHRMERFHSWNQLTFVNDSKGTNIESTRYALSACPGCVLILGGHDKKFDWTPLAGLVKTYASRVYLIGETTPVLESVLREAGCDPAVLFPSGTLEKALRHMRETLDPGTPRTILLSPATSSYDQFKNFEERGRIFKALTREIF